MIEVGQRYRRATAGATTLWEVVSVGGHYATLRKISKDGTIASTVRNKPITMNVSTEGLEFFERVS